MSRKQKLKRIWAFAWRLLSMSAMSVMCWAIMHFGTRLLYGALHVDPSESVASLITYITGQWLTMVSFITVGFLLRHKRKQAFAPLIEAIRRIGRGEFHEPIPLDDVRRGHPFGDLIDSINTMASELSQMERMRQQFISNVSHEFQSPLTSIGGFARALRNEELGAEERHRYLRIIEKECSRLSRLSDNLLKLTSLESEHQPVHMKLYRLDRQLRAIVLNAEPQWTEKRLDIEAELEELTIEADEELLSQVWINLLHNSIKFTPQGGAIRIKAVPDGKGGARVDFSDTGIGMTAEEQTHVFERFYKADRARGREAGGSGLGLAIVKTIVDLHGGTVTVCSTPGEGSTFTVLLPGPRQANEAPEGKSEGMQ
ncbi:sensor histidine kinase [Gordoniibacillus kamchatkensis]|uniref:sensor histidine kinase n=1 Tax=Gordoniibacillus kamchatkensis TaxID=1590651 RepID=UPI000A6A9372|nr:HAMP domain-containing sensor histidine kinase [Paenibacillus sp. VKM B-2647]